MIFKSLLLVGCLFVSTHAFASAVGKTSLRGYVTGFDQKNIWIESGNQKIEVPRKFYSGVVKTGELVLIAVDEKELDSFKHTTIKAEKK